MLGFIGGTGPEGRGLALRFALAGERVLIGSRDESRAKQAVETISNHLPPDSIQGVHNSQAARESSIILITVPFDAQKTTLEGLKGEMAGKIVVDVVAPLTFVRGRAKAVPVEEGSAALQAQKLLPESRIVAAFQNISADDLLIPDKAVECDVVVCSDDSEAKTTIMKLAERIKGVRAVDGGGLENARYVEDFTALLLNINRIYKGRHSMIKIAGI
ncbi:MAG: NADPH-dependent F420 reductase [Chloroflexi bacterium]|nr:NADPH-dependent F420 reductase [Chloroflexota bacterium]